MRAACALLRIRYHDFSGGAVDVPGCGDHIEDASQGLFVKRQYQESSCTLSGRKFLGVPDGGSMTMSTTTLI